MSRSLLPLFCALCIVIPVGCNGQPESQQKTTSSEAANTSESGTVVNSSPPAEPASTDPAWEYRSSTDPMGRGNTEYASLDSVNSVDFDFPYSGGSTATLLLRNSPKSGKNVIFEVNKGQFDCGVDGCSVALRADKGKVVTLSADTAADGSSNVLFLPHSTTVRYLQHAKVLRIEATFYQEGSRVFEFHPYGLDIKRLAK